MDRALPRTGRPGRGWQPGPGGVLGAHTGPGGKRLKARLIGADRLYAVATGDDTSDVHAQDTTVLLDDDTTSWAS